MNTTEKQDQQSQQEECKHPNACMYEPSLNRAFCPDCQQIVTIEANKIEQESKPQEIEKLHLSPEVFLEDNLYKAENKVNELVKAVNYLLNESTSEKSR